MGKGKDPRKETKKKPTKTIKEKKQKKKEKEHISLPKISTKDDK